MRLAISAVVAVSVAEFQGCGKVKVVVRLRFSIAWPKRCAWHAQACMRGGGGVGLKGECSLLLHTLHVRACAF